MEGTFRDEHWGTLLDQMRQGKCVPFLGAGASGGRLPCPTAKSPGRLRRLDPAAIAQRWAIEYHYPGGDTSNLARVSQWVALQCGDWEKPKALMADIMRGAIAPKFRQRTELHAVLARLPLTVFVTTNYESYMEQALQEHGKQPQQVLCRWRDDLHLPPEWTLPGEYEPTEQQPLVFHLHGHADVSSSIVLTENDYLDFLVNLKYLTGLLPPIVQEAFITKSLLFLGYGLGDVNVQVVLRANEKMRLKGLNVSVQRRPRDRTEARRTRSQQHWEKHMDQKGILVAWEKCEEFAKELAGRLEA